MTESEVNIYSIAYRDCKEVSDSIDVNEEFGKTNTILFYMDEILEALKIASELQEIGTVEELKALKNIGEWAYSKGYNKAIDEFAEKLKYELNGNIIPDNEKFTYTRKQQEQICHQNTTLKRAIKYVDYIAEQLKKEGAV